MIKELVLKVSRNNGEEFLFNFSFILILECQEYHEAVRGIKLGLPRNFSGKMCVASIPLIVGGEITQRDEYPHMVD